jgi:hypothetical protein
MQEDMSLYVCHGDNKGDLEKAENLKKVFLKLAFENRILINPLELDNNLRFHFDCTNNRYRMCKMEINLKNSSVKRFARFYDMVEDELDDIVTFVGNRAIYE